MATIGRGVYAEAVHEFFEGVRTYDAARACAVLADDAELHGLLGEASDKAGIQALLEPMLAPSLQRPSFTIMDISGDGNVVTLKVSVSGRFGSGAKRQTWQILHLKGVIHHIVVS